VSAPTVATRLQRMAAQARQHPALPCTTLAPLLDVDLRRDAYHPTRRDGAPGVDGVTAAAYGASLEANRADLHARRRSGRYDAPPVTRPSVPKADGRQRPIGMPAVADKGVQRAVARLLGAIDAHDLHEGAYGFRRGRSPPQARPVVRERGRKAPMGWSVDAEVRACFESVDHDLWCEGRRPRGNEGASRRVIRTGLRAGVLEGDTLSSPERGSPQGGVVSPMRAHTCLDHVLEAWVEREVKPRLQGRGFRLRCADDGVMGGEREGEARRRLGVWPQRVARVQRTLQPPQTGLGRFQPPRQADEGARGDGTCACLGRPHDGAKSRRGDWVIKRRTAKQRRRRAMRAGWPWCRTQRHAPLRDPYRVRCQKRRGHDQDDGSRGHDRQLAAR
jgi:RNA-directed DNA polymerase